MSLDWWLGIGAGVVVMAGHAVLRVLTHRIALERGGQRSFLLVELGGLGVRMALVFGAVAGGLLYVPVHEVTFVGTVLLLLVLSMILETRLIIRHLN